MEKPLGLYVHVPFCLRKCPYCDFYSIPHSEEITNAYMSAILADMQAWRGKTVTADTLYFGGGTPILLSAEQIAAIIETARAVFSLNGEVTLEANPNSTTPEKLTALKNAGINRISFGIQSSAEQELCALGRLHTAEQAITAVNAAAAAGISNISVDLMLGTPYQTMESMETSIDTILALPVSHVSAYLLKVEESTPYYQSELLRHCADEDCLADMYLRAIEKFEEKGFVQYEISNFAKEGLQSRHNLKYWRCENYLGFGPSAHSFYKDRRYYNAPDLSAYLQAHGCAPIMTDENGGGADEMLLLGLRLTEGIDLARFKGFGLSDWSGFLIEAKRFCDSGHMQCKGDNLSFTPAGFLISNSILASLLQFV